MTAQDLELTEGKTSDDVGRPDPSFLSCLRGEESRGVKRSEVGRLWDELLENWLLMFSS
jgi:hypothetical protein